MQGWRSEGLPLVDYDFEIKRSIRKKRKKIILSRHMEYTSTPPTIELCQLCKSPWHSPLECPLKFESPEFLQNNEHIMQDYMYQMDMHQRAMNPPLFSEKQSHELPYHSFEPIIAELEDTHRRLAAKVHEPYETFTPLSMKR